MTGVAEERQARAVLARVAEPGDPAMFAAVSAHGAPAILAGLRGGDACVGSDPGSSRRVAGYLSRLPAALAEDPHAEADRCGVRLVCPGDPEWPTQLDQLAASEGSGPARVPPLALWVHGGDLRAAAVRSISVIGARAATGYGEQVAADLAAGLAAAGWTVVSGAAYGVDAAAHRGALAVGGTTVAVLPCGVDVRYPRSHARLIDRIAAEGTLVSELPPGRAVTRSRLLQRNRLVAALSRGTVVVEAAVRSGTASTAGHAAALHRPVMAVPGPVTSALSVGCHELLRHGRAVLVTDAGDVLDVVGDLGADAAAGRRGPERPADGLTPRDLRVLDALPVRQGVGVTRLARTAGLGLDEVRAGLGVLLAAGAAERHGEGYRLAAALRSSS